MYMRLSYGPRLALARLRRRLLSTVRFTAPPLARLRRRLLSTGRFTAPPLVALLLGVAGAATSPRSTAQTAPASLTTGPYAALTPTRLVDTRAGLSTVDGVLAGTGRLAAGSPLRVPVVGRGGVPADGTLAVFVNITVVDPAGPGFVTTWASGTGQPLASTLNFAGGQTVANGALVPVGADGHLMVSASSSVHLLVDVQGHVRADSGLRPLNPARLVDTRSPQSTVDGLMSGTGRLADGGTMEVDVVGRGGVAGSNVSAALLNVTVVDATAAGFITVWPTGATRPTASAVNYGVGQTVANNVFVGLGRLGKVSVFASGATHLVIDVVGFVTSGSAPMAIQPHRLLDTRATGDAAVRTQSARDLQVVGSGGVPSSGVGAVVVNVTVTQPLGAGFVTAWPTGRTRPNASIVNYGSGVSVANGTILPVGDNGRISLYASSATHLIVDVVGWLPGDSPVPKPIFGMNLAPFIGGPPALTLTGSLARELTGQISPYTEWIRTYECSGAFSEFPIEARRLGRKIAVGGWISRDAARNRREVDCVIAQAQAGRADLVIIGSESVARGDVSESQLVSFIREIRAVVTVPVTTAEPDPVLFAHPALMSEASVVFANVSPFFTGIPIDRALSALQATYAQLRNANPGKTIYISETGWPACGAARGGAIPSAENSARYLNEVAMWASSAGVAWFWFEAYDQAWKATTSEGVAGACAGLWTAGGELKPGMRATFG